MKPSPVEAAVLSQPTAQDLELSGFWTARGIGVIERQLETVRLASKTDAVADGTHIEALDTAGAWVLYKLLTRLRGGNVVVTALTPDTIAEIKIPPLELFVTQKAIMGAVYGFASPRVQIPELLALYRNGSLKLRELITQTYRLDEINRGYADLEAGKNLRGVVVFDR